MAMREREREQGGGKILWGWERERGVQVKGMWRSRNRERGIWG